MKKKVINKFVFLAAVVFILIFLSLALPKFTGLVLSSTTNPNPIYGTIFMIIAIMIMVVYLIIGSHKKQKKRKN